MLPDSEEGLVVAPDLSNLPPGRKPYARQRHPTSVSCRATIHQRPDSVVSTTTS